MALAGVGSNCHRTVLLTMMMFKWGIFCSESSDKCLSSPCQNGATCVNTMDDYACLCPREPVLYMGKDCELLYDGCALATCANCTSTPGTEEYACPCPDTCPVGSAQCDVGPCLNGGTCVGRADGFQCRCAPGFRGERCQEDVDECASEPCHNGAICVDGVGAHRCFCVPGFQGYNCEIDINECASRPCRNNGSCINEKDHYICECHVGYTGVNCEVEIDECDSNPCQNGADCQDLLGMYTCECLPGFQGLDCEVDIDECASDPCYNGGTCNDHVNRYECDCSDTGFGGEHCEEDIPECSSNPCQNNATCLEGVKQYSCLCWPGYEGEHCEVDIDECAEAPCENEGECLQRSDGVQLLEPEFSYAHAAGYLCRCRPGYEGETCSVNIDECASAPCQNGGICEDQVDAYACACLPGFAGRECEVDIDECQSQPCQNGALCEDRVADYACQCPEAQPGELPWGGRDCQLSLTGCIGHGCENGAVCQPWLGEDGEHGYSCHCPPGFHGQLCATPTTFSFSNPGFVLIEVPPTNRSRRDLGFLGASVELRFRTTLPDAILFYRGDSDGYLTLEMVGGSLRARAVSEDVMLEAGFSEPLNDGEWRDVAVSLGQRLVLALRGSDCHAKRCVVEDGGPPLPHFHPPESFVQLFVGGVAPHLLDHTESGVGFVGCMEDLLVDHQPVLPQSISQEQAQDMELGCNKTEWCHPDPCSGRGHCIDLWIAFVCACRRPFHGDSCSEEFSTWAFSHEETLSYASYEVGHSGHGANFSLSLFLRSLKRGGLVFQLRRGGEAYFTLQLEDGLPLIHALSAPPIAGPVLVTSGEWEFLTVELQHGTLFFRQGGLSHRLEEVPEVEVLEGDVAYVGGLGEDGGVEAWGGHFKGCLQDVRLDGVQLEFGEWSDTSPVSSYLPSHVENVQPGCISDDACQVGPCHNGGDCEVTWNDFACVCPGNFTGRTCETRLWCTSDPCDLGARCLDLLDGYECITEATFDSNGLQYSANGSLVAPVTSVSLSLRTRVEDGVLLGASNGVELFQLSLHHSSLLVQICCHNGVEGLIIASETPVSDGRWHHVQVFMVDPSRDESPWALAVDGQDNQTSAHVAGDLRFLNETTVWLAADYVGCLGEVRVGGVYLPLGDGPPPPQQARFLRQGEQSVQAGCSGGPVCLSQPCQNHGSCEDLFGLFTCHCAPGWEGELCQTDTDECASEPCLHGSCQDQPAGFRCECQPGYGGEACQDDLDECLGHDCENGGSCMDQVGSYTCVCPPHFTGTHCQWRYPPLQCEEDVECANKGVCQDGPWGANCTCQPGYAGDRCELDMDECESRPCQHGASCLDRLNGFQCMCAPGFMGPLCETSKREQRERVPWLVVAVPLVCCCVLLAALGLAYAAMTARRKRRSEGAYSPSRQEVAGARLEMDSVLKVPPEERLI